jgi:uracil-DNA glycosylase family 4
MPVHNVAAVAASAIEWCRSVFHVFSRGTPAMTSWNRLNQRIVDCRLCPRLAAYIADVAARKRAAFRDWDYWAHPVPNFGDSRARLLIVGLAPAAHGANRTGRMFTGDKSGEWLYRALHKAGFASTAISESADDGLELADCAITAVCHCAPPDNKPTRDEQANCSRWLDQTFDLVPVVGIVALGQIAWHAAFDAARRRNWAAGPRPGFGHGKCVRLAGGRWLLASYHPSQQNTFTGRLTRKMFDHVFSRARALLDNR